MRAPTFLLTWLCIILLPIAAHSNAPQQALVQGSQVVLRDWRAALHAPDWSASRGATLVTHSNDEGVLSDDIIRITANCDFHDITNREFDSSETVVTDKFATRRDWNGFLRKITRAELGSLKTEILELSTILFGPSPAMDSALISKDSLSHAVIVKLSQPNCDTLTFFLESTTMRPIKSIRSADGVEIVTTYSDWREVDGILTPFQGTVTTTDRPDYTWTRTECKIGAPLGPKDFTPPSAGPTDTYFSGPAQPIPFNFENDHVIFKISVNGKEPIWFMLDTGADPEVFNSRRIDLFGLHMYGKSATEGGGNTTEFSFASGASFTLPGIEVRNQHVSLLDESGLEAAYGMVIGGILGFDFISRFVVEIDYEKKLITFHDPGTWKYSGSGLVVPITLDAGIPYASATIDVPTKSIPADMLIDFGAAETMTLTSPFVAANNLVALAGTKTSVNKMAGLENQFFAQTNVRGRIDRFTMGALVVDSFPVNLSQNKHGGYASSSFSGTIGEGIDKRYHVFIDYSNERIVFEPTADAAKPFTERKTYGMTLLASGDDLHTYTIAGIRAGSPAESDSLKKGDIIAGLDEKTAAQFTLGELRDQLAKDGQAYTLAIKRGTDLLKKEIKIRRISLEQK